MCYFLIIAKQPLKTIGSVANIQGTLMGISQNLRHAIITCDDNETTIVIYVKDVIAVFYQGLHLHFLATGLSLSRHELFFGYKLSGFLQSLLLCYLTGVCNGNRYDCP